MRTFLLTASIMFLTSCSSGPTIVSNANPQVNLSSFSTYNFMQPLGTDRPNGVQTPLSSMLISSITGEMDRRGFSLSANPDLLVNVYVNTEDKVDVRQTPTMGGYYGYRGARYGGWGGYETTVSQYTQGTLSIDLVDISSNVLAWEGLAQGRMSSKAQEVTQQRSDEVVAQIFAEFPLPAAIPPAPQ